MRWFPTYRRGLCMAICVLGLASGGDAQGQFGGPPKLPKPPTPKAPAGPVPKKWKVLDRRYDSQDDIRAADITLRAGDRATGRVATGTVHRLRFAAPIDGRLTLRLSGHTARLPLTATLRDPLGDTAATLDPVKSRPGLYQLDSFPIHRSGMWLLEITSPHAEVNTFELSTALELPTSRREDVAMDDGRPLLLELGGMPGRSLADLRLRGLTGENSRQFIARLVDPDGIPCDLTPYLRESSTGAITLSRVPLEIAGTWRLTLADRARGQGDVRLEMRYDNPPAGHTTHRL